MWIADYSESVNLGSEKMDGHRPLQLPSLPSLLALRNSLGLLICWVGHGLNLIRFNYYGEPATFCWGGATPGIGFGAGIVGAVIT